MADVIGLGFFVEVNIPVYCRIIYTEALRWSDPRWDPSMPPLL
jgi:hypothetical protein